MTSVDAQPSGTNNTTAIANENDVSQADHDMAGELGLDSGVNHPGPTFDMHAEDNPSEKQTAAQDTFGQLEDNQHE